MKQREDAQFARCFLPPTFMFECADRNVVRLRVLLVVG